MTTGLVVCLFALVGCSSASTGSQDAGSSQSSHAEEGDDDHAHHVIPDHKPETFPEAVEQLEERTSPQASRDATSIQELKDIIGWLPELAAQTDLPRADWEAIYGISGEMSQLDWNDAATFKSSHLAGDLQTLSQLAEKAKQVDTFNTYGLMGENDV